MKKEQIINLINNKITEVENELPMSYCGEWESKIQKEKKEAKIDVLNELITDIEKQI